MDDLISRAAAKEAIRKKFKSISDRCEINGVINGLPAVDAVLVVRGRWEEVDDMWGDIHYRCSACGCEWFLEDGTPEENGMKFCPECGAKMDGDT